MVHTSTPTFGAGRRSSAGTYSQRWDQLKLPLWWKLTIVYSGTVFALDGFRPDGFRPDCFRPVGFRPGRLSPWTVFALGGFRPDGFRLVAALLKAASLKTSPNSFKTLITNNPNPEPLS